MKVIHVCAVCGMFWLFGSLFWAIFGGLMI